MPAYNFRKTAKLYVVQNGLKYLLDVFPDYSFSQTFNETNVPVKTLHAQKDLFENAVITKANPANFSFTIPLILESDLDVVFFMLRDYDSNATEVLMKTADIYVETDTEVFKLDTAVIEAAMFQIPKDGVITINVSGTAKKLTRSRAAVPGTLQPRNAGRNYTIPTSLKVTIGGVVQPYITSVTVELKNNIQWLDFGTLQNSLGISSASGTMYPEAFVVSSRTLSGTIQQYLTDDTAVGTNSWSIGGNLLIEATQVERFNQSLQILVPSVVYTNRTEVQDMIIQSYDWRMNTSPSSLTSIITKRSI